MASNKKIGRKRAPAVIIPPEHAAVARGGVVPAQQQYAPAINTVGKASLWHDDYDTEMDLKAYHDPTINAEIEEMQRRDPVKPTQFMLEELERQYEKNMAAEDTKRMRWAGQERWQGRENEQMRLVNILHPHTFLRRLRSAGIAADLFRYGNSRIWLNDWSRAGLIGCNAMVWDASARRNLEKTVTVLQYPYGPEWTLMRFDEHNVPTNERYRGWRTALLALIFEGVLTEAEAHRAFGEPRGKASHFYRKQLYAHRAIRLGLVA